MNSTFFTTTHIILLTLPGATGILLMPYIAGMARAGLVTLLIATNFSFLHSSQFSTAAAFTHIPMNLLVTSTLLRCVCAGIGAYASAWIIQWISLAWRSDDAADAQANLVERVHPVVGLTMVIAWWQAGAWQPALAPILPGLDAVATHSAGLDADAVLGAIDAGLQTIARSAWPILLVHTGLLLPTIWFGRAAGSDGAQRLLALGVIPALWAAAPVYGAWAIDGVAAALRATGGAP